MKNETAQHSREKEDVLDLWEILLSVCGKLWLILLVALMCGGIMFAYIESTYVPTYASGGSIYLVTKRSGSDDFTVSEVGVAETFMQDYIYYICTEENMRDAVRRLPDEIRAIYGDSYPEEELNAYIERAVSGLSWSALRNATTIYNEEDTHYLKISVRATDAKLAYAAANAVMNTSLDSLSEFFALKIDTIQISEKPNYREAPVSGKPYRNVLLAALIGAVLVIAVLVLLYIRDDKINTSEDVEQHLGLAVLAMIPAYETAGAGKKKREAGKDRSEA